MRCRPAHQRRQSSGDGADEGEIAVTDDFDIERDVDRDDQIADVTAEATDEVLEDVPAMAEEQEMADE